MEFEQERTSDCKNCTIKRSYILDKRARMYKKRCYIDRLAEKTGESKLHLMELFDEFAYETGFLIKDCIHYWYDSASYWRKLDEHSKRLEVSEMITLMQDKRKKWDVDYIPCSEKVFNTYCTLIVALLNTYLSAWRNEDYVQCLCCGKIFGNNKQHNRKYCDDCRGYQRKIYVWRTCPDCGEEFKVKAPNNRQYRCPECQQEADKLAARQRAKKYRERKNHGIN